MICQSRADDLVLVKDFTSESSVASTNFPMNQQVSFQTPVFQGLRSGMFVVGSASRLAMPFVQQSLSFRAAEPRLAIPSSRAARGRRFRLPEAVSATAESQAWDVGGFGYPKRR
jgi:hypothetical protein